MNIWGSGVRVYYIRVRCVIVRVIEKDTVTSTYVPNQRLFTIRIFLERPESHPPAAIQLLMQLWLGMITGIYNRRSPTGRHKVNYRRPDQSKRLGSFKAIISDCG